MKRQFGPVLIAVATFGMSACHFPGLGGHPKAPVGEVVATVDGREITQRDLRAELAGTNVSDPKQFKQAEQKALQQIVGRTLLAKEAQAQGIDKTPDFALQKQRAMDNLLAQALEERIAATVPAPTREEAQSFVSGHPNIFSERKIFSIDQIRIARPDDPTVLEALRPLNTLDDIVALLSKDGIKFQRGLATLDAVGADPNMVAAIMKLPPHEVFVFPSGKLVLINQIKDSRVEPFTGEPAVTYALNLLKRQHTKEAVQRQINAVLAKGAKSVSFNKAYQPAPAAPQPNAGAGGAKAS